MPKISVIVPIYKVEKYINKCVDSILAQTFTDFELVLVDDGSPDSCPQICDEYTKKDPRIVVIHKENGGLSDARNAGIDWAFENSDSEWLAFVDSDDYLHADYLEKLYEAAINTGADLAVCDFVRVNEAGDIVEKEHDFIELESEDKSEFFKYLNSNWRLRPAWNKLYKKELFNDLRFAFGKIHEDDFIIHHILWRTRKITVTGYTLYYYLIRSSSIMGTKSIKSKLDGIEAAIEQCEFCHKNGLPLNAIIYYPKYVERFMKLKTEIDEENIGRYRELKRRYARMYFAKKSNKNIKKLISFYGIKPKLFSKQP